ncbi:hypothetical protein ElyMa_001886100 [Elysia marginata]|uniref:Uncharacterized protein n=1 Tax=Elysia marginata TaxID=1093978 RepID=A0AAV4EQQ8_9GAST|nr:hypothetical protein ElyMa_001886100 [Elysia marginata]
MPLELNAILTPNSKVKVISAQQDFHLLQDSGLRRHNSLGSAAGLFACRRKCVVTLDGHRYTIETVQRRYRDGIETVQRRSRDGIETIQRQSRDGLETVSRRSRNGPETVQRRSEDGPEKI